MKLLKYIFLFLPFFGFGQSADGTFKTVTASGTNSYTISEVLKSPDAYDVKEKWIVTFTNGNTGAVTINRNSLGAKGLKKLDGSDFASGDIPAGGRLLITYNGTYYQGIGIAGTSTFVGLTDGPGSFSGKSLNYTRVNIGETALQYRTPSQVLSDIGAQSAITFGTGVQSALGNNIGSAGSPVLFNGAGGTPSSLILTNASGLPISGITGLGTNWSTALGASLGSGWTTALNAAYAGLPPLGTALQQLQVNSAGTALEYFSPTTNPMTALGDLIIGGTVTSGTALPIRLAIGGANTVLHGGGTSPSYSSVVEADFGFTDITTANVSTSAHGLTPKLPNNAALYLDGTGNFSAPSIGGTAWATTGTTTLGGAVTITGTSSNTIKFGFASLGAVQTEGAGLYLQNSTAAAAGAQQWSPSTTWEGNGWKTNSTAGSQVVKFTAFVLPEQGAANPTGSWTLAGSVNGAAYTTSTFTKGYMKFNTTGQLLIGTFQTTLASSALEANGALVIQSSGGVAALTLLNSGSDGYVQPAGKLILRSNGASDAVTITTGQNVLIGTATDNSKLTVNGSFATAYVAKTGTYTATSSDYTIDCTSGTFTVTLPTAVGITGRIYYIVNSGAGTITVGTTSSQTFANVTATPTTLTMAAVGYRAVQSNGANWNVIGSL